MRGPFSGSGGRAPRQPQKAVKPATAGQDVAVLWPVLTGVLIAAALVWTAATVFRRQDL